jgi:cell division protein FtsB
MRAETRRTVIAAVILAVLGALWLTFSPYGWLRLRRAETRRRVLEEKAAALEEENRRLRARADCLEGNDRPCFEEVARRDYGLLRRDEIIMVPVPDKKKGK